MEKSVYQNYVQILKEELIPAMGCTEPIAVAYAAAMARQTLGAQPQTLRVAISGNIIKNVKSVVVPNTGGLRGIAAAAAAGAIAGDAARKLEVLSSVTPAQADEIAAYLQNAEITVSESKSGCIFDIDVTAEAGGHSAGVRITGYHTNIVTIQKDGVTLLSRDYQEQSGDQTERGMLSILGIVEFADAADLADVKELLDRQIAYNMAIAREGLRGDWGANIGNILQKAYGDSVAVRAKAMAAAGSDARMSGCELPVVVNSGSGNQGMTASLPVIVYAEALGVSDEQRYRALLVSNLVTIHLKTGIGRLSAYCGAISAGCGAGAGVSYLYGGRYDEIAHTVVNALAINSGVICDGAKPSCAAKIASAVEAGLLGMQMVRYGKEFFGGDGIVSKGVENTIRNVGELARDGMRDTDREILQIMIGNANSGAILSQS
ncbi:MAG: L-serine ammonia-lyase, iron-sulfur-dependent, subunit alpha [Oscillospiraceae bacterium]|nr:L-serine ammonia-lyase, iron-sulfur-dependent, subunit alpha [Oscillospiraceae bacterium]